MERYVERWFLLSLVSLNPLACWAGPVGHLVSFERIAARDEAPQDDGNLVAPYTLSNGIALDFKQFQDTESGFTATPNFERTFGSNSGPDAFSLHDPPADCSRFDTPRDCNPFLAQRLGDYVLRPEGDIDTRSPLRQKWRITLTGEVHWFSGEIWDLDSISADETEQFEVRAYTSSGSAPVASLTSPVGVTQTEQSNPELLDGKPWLFRLYSSEPIAVVEIEHIGSKTSGLGYALNNVAASGGLPGDYNLDGSVDAADYTVFRDGLSNDFAPEDWWLWFDSYGLQPPTPAAAVPEPHSLTLVLLACCGTCRRRGTLRIGRRASYPRAERVGT